MNMDVIKLFRTFEKYILVVFAALFVVFVLPKFNSPYVVPKEIFGVVAVSLFLILWAVRLIIKGQATFSIGKFDLGVFLLVLTYIVSAIFRTPNKMEAFFFPGTVTFVIVAAIFYFLLNQFDKKTKNLVLMTLFGSGILLAVSVLFAQFGVFTHIPQLPAFMKDVSFNAAGGNLPSVIYLVVLLPLGIISIIRQKDIVVRTFLVFSSIVIGLGAVMIIINMLPGKPTSLVLPGLQTSWEVLIETLKTSPILGAGPDNYLTAFNLFRPLSYNQTALWLTRFSTATNYYFTLITEVGFAGLAAISIILIGVYRTVKTNLKAKNWEIISLALLAILLAVFPSAPNLIFLLMALLAVFSRSEEKSVSLATSRVPAVIIAAPVILGIAALALFGTRAVRAELTYQKALGALAANDAQSTYNLITASVNQNPYVDRYHASLAQLDMALANSIASRKTTLSDADRSTITQLVQQAISEGKAAVTLNPSRSGNWSVLAQIYGSIMPFAQGADQFAIQAYTQAVALDPINPNLRIALGGVYYALGRYGDAIDAFKLAVLTKSDLANTHYNLAIAYRDSKDFDNAIAEMNIVLTLVPKDSSDYTLAQTTLADLQKNKPATSTAPATGNLTTPQKQITTIKPPITLPQEATPPATR
jgi:tetratricopeptide (TPR) repeat protein